MSKIKFIILTIIGLVLLSLILLPVVYGFHFGLGIRSAVQKVMEEGQRKDKLPKGKLPTREDYAGRAHRLDLRGARYLFLAESPARARSSSETESSLYMADSSLTPAPTPARIIFKIKEDGTIEEVKVHDEEGNVFDIEAHYIIKVGNKFISICLSIRGVYRNNEFIPLGGRDPERWRRKRYLVRLEDGAVFEVQGFGGRGLPDTGTKTIYEDIYGNFYYSPLYDGVGVPGISSYAVFKLNTKNMSIEVISKQEDDALGGFAVDKFGNLAYLSSRVGKYVYRKTTGTVDGTGVEHKEFFLLPGAGFRPITNKGQDAIFLIDSPFRSYLRIRKLECNPNTLYKIKISSVVNQAASAIFDGVSSAKILDIGEEDVSLLLLPERWWGDRIICPTLNLTNATTTFYSEVRLRDLVGEDDFSKAFLGYQIVNSTTMYVLIKRQGQQWGRYRYTFFAIYFKEGKFEEIFHTEKYELTYTYEWQPFTIDEAGNIIVPATDLDDGTRNILKIKPNPANPGDPNNITFLQRGQAQILYLVRVN